MLPEFSLSRPFSGKASKSADISPTMALWPFPLSSPVSNEGVMEQTPSSTILVRPDDIVMTEEYYLYAIEEA